jgi:hypothetical protein
MSVRCNEPVRTWSSLLAFRKFRFSATATKIAVFFCLHNNRKSKIVPDRPSLFLHSLLYTLGYPKTWSDRAKSLTLPRWFGWEAGLFLLAPQTSEDVQHSGHERIWARVRPERYGFKRWNIGLERPEDHPPCRQFLR